MALGGPREGDKEPCTALCPLRACSIPSLASLQTPLVGSGQSQQIRNKIKQCNELIQSLLLFKPC